MVRCHIYPTLPAITHTHTHTVSWKTDAHCLNDSSVPLLLHLDPWALDATKKKREYLCCVELLYAALSRIRFVLDWLCYCHYCLYFTYLYYMFVYGVHDAPSVKDKPDRIEFIDFHWSKTWKIGWQTNDVPGSGSSIKNPQIRKDDITERNQKGNENERESEREMFV